MITKIANKLKELSGEFKDMFYNPDKHITSDKTSDILEFYGNFGSKVLDDLGYKRVNTKAFTIDDYRSQRKKLLKERDKYKNDNSKFGLMKYDSITDELSELDNILRNKSTRFNNYIKTLNEARLVAINNPNYSKYSVGFNVKDTDIMNNALGHEGLEALLATRGKRLGYLYPKSTKKRATDRLDELGYKSNVDVPKNHIWDLLNRNSFKYDVRDSSNKLVDNVVHADVRIPIFERLLRDRAKDKDYPAYKAWKKRTSIEELILNDLGKVKDPNQPYTNKTISDIIKNQKTRTGGTLPGGLTYELAWPKPYNS